ncbi:MAG TPA: ABC transporter substrate-binding protein [Chloroflexi bacterium]|nr:ABC transporter substrate-binding protein [Chloroflexota bacterium]|tara:strand:+ start:1149 stop:2396 length:1248 start_codon:yes stop_codon:yes gene_type:complete
MTTKSKLYKTLLYDKQFSRREVIKLSGAGAAIYGLNSLLSSCNTSQIPQTTIGLLLPFSGIYASLGESIYNGMRIYFDEIQNKVAGNNLFIIAEDTEMKPDVAQQKARKLIEQDNVDLVTGIVSTGVLYGLRDYFHNNKKFLICSNAGGNKISREMKSPYIWRSSFSNWQPNWPLGIWAYENVATKVFVSAPDYGAGHNMVDAFSNSFQSAGGKIINKQFTPFPSMGDPAPYITEIQQSRPQMVYCFYSGSSAVSFINAYHDFGLSNDIPIVCSGFTVEEDVLPAQGSAALGIKSGLHWALSLDNPANINFVKKYKNLYDHNANVFAVQGYDTAKIIAEMINEVQGDSDNINGMINYLKQVNFESPRGSFGLDANSQNPTQNIYVREVKEINGNLQNVVIENLGSFTDPGNNSLG